MCGPIGDALIQAAARVNPDDVIHQEWQGTTVGYRAATIVIQAIQHGIEHGTNITTILAQEGMMPPDIDGWGYMWANPDRLGAS